MWSSGDNYRARKQGGTSTEEFYYLRDSENHVVGVPILNYFAIQGCFNLQCVWIWWVKYFSGYYGYHSILFCLQNIIWRGISEGIRDCASCGSIRIVLGGSSAFNDIALSGRCLLDI